MKHIFRFWGRVTNAEVPFLWEIEESEFSQIKRVLKLPVSTPVEVQDRQGQWAQGTITVIEENRVLVTTEKLHKQSPPQREVHLFLGATKSTHFEEALPSLVELGTHHIHFFLQAHTPKHRIAEKQCIRWQKILDSAAKQCKRAGTPQITTYSALSSALDKTRNLVATKLVLQPGGQLSYSKALSQRSEQRLFIVVGGEAGLNEEELALLRAESFLSVHCGPLILRAVTASILAASSAQL